MSWVKRVLDELCRTRVSCVGIAGLVGQCPVLEGRTKYDVSESFGDK